MMAAICLTAWTQPRAMHEIVTQARPFMHPAPINGQVDAQ